MTRAEPCKNSEQVRGQRIFLHFQFVIF
jgi:hypothetical protein